MIQVLIVDDSPTQRQLLRAVLESDPELRVVGEASNGEEALVQCERWQPDLITMDLYMPRMDGHEAIRRIMAESPRPIVVVTIAAAGGASRVLYQALENGALTVLGQPSGRPGEDPAADQLIAQVKAMAGVKVVRRHWRGPKETPTPPQKARAVKPAIVPVRLIAIGVSTGGPPALQVLFHRLPADLPVPVVVVQHISPGFMPGLARWLDETTPLRVKVAENGESLRPGTVYLAPDEQHLLVTGSGRAWLQTSPPVDGHRPSITVLFEAVAQHYGSAAAGVLLTGMGCDGARGLQRMRQAGGRTFAQDEATCVVFGMPQRALELGAVEEVLPPEQIGDRLAEWGTGDTERGRHGEGEARRRGDTEKGRHGEGETRRHSDTQTPDTQTGR